MVHRVPVETRYWDPVASLPSQVGAVLAEGSNRPIPPLETIFAGTWAERNWRNVPGPLYGAMTDNCWVGRLSAPDHILYGDDIDYEQEFLYRQPADASQLLRVLDGMWQDPWAGWAADGDKHWTTELVRGWWRDRGRVSEWINRATARWLADNDSKPSDDALDVVAGLRDYSVHLNGDLELRLQIYSFWLDTGRSRRRGESLPAL